MAELLQQMPYEPTAKDYRESCLRMALGSTLDLYRPEEVVDAARVFEAYIVADEPRPTGQ